MTDMVKVWQLKSALDTLPDDTEMYVNKVGYLSLVENKEFVGIINVDWMEIEYFDDRGYYIKFDKQSGPEIVWDEEE